MLLTNGREQCEESGYGSGTASEPEELLPLAKGKWLAKEKAKVAQRPKSDLVLLIKKRTGPT